MNPLVSVYARVSSLQQEQEATIDSQVAELEKYAREQGYRLAKELYFLAQAVSGAQLARPALDRLRDLAGEGLFETVLCLSPDRLSRQYAHQWILMDELKRASVKVVFVNQPAVEDNPQGQLLLGIQGLFSEYERAVITDRLRRGKLHRVRQGELVNPVPPYGYRYIPVSEPRQDVGMVFQSPVLLPWRTVWDNILFPIEIMKYPFADYHEKTKKLIDLVHGERKASTFSVAAPRRISRST